VVLDCLGDSVSTITKVRKYKEWGKRKHHPVFSLFIYCSLNFDFAWRLRGWRDGLRSKELILALGSTERFSCDGVWER
jgi:hypothetical protein